MPHDQLERGIGIVFIDVNLSNFCNWLIHETFGIYCTRYEVYENQVFIWYSSLTARVIDRVAYEVWWNIDVLPYFNRSNRPKSLKFSV